MFLKSFCTHVPLTSLLVFVKFWLVVAREILGNSSNRVRTTVDRRLSGPRLSTSCWCLFQQLFTDEVWDLLVEETNRVATQERVTVTSPSCRPWHDVDREEMKAFVSMIMAMRICKLPRLEMYWSTSHPLLTPEGVEDCCL